MHYHNVELDMILRGIVMTRGELGATIAEMREDFYNIMGEPWPLNRVNTKKIIEYLLEIDGLMMERLDTGLCIWYIDDIGSNVSERELDSNNNVIVINDTIMSSAMHEDMLIETIENAISKRTVSSMSQGTSQSDTQKRRKLIAPEGLPLIEQNLDIHNRNSGAIRVPKQTTSTEIENSISTQCDLNPCLDNDYLNAPITASDSCSLPIEFTKQCNILVQNLTQTESANSTESARDGILPDYIALIGDFFMRSLISFELYGSDFTDEEDNRFGYCMSTQSIREAYNLVFDKKQHFTSNYRYILVNVGAIDILMERELVDIMTDYARLIKAITLIGMQPIITTIPYVCVNKNNKNQKIIYQTLLLFNQFLMSSYSDGYFLIDLFSSLYEKKMKRLSVFYHNEPKTIFKGKWKFELWCWTEYGRKRILGQIEEYIGRCLRK